MRALFCIAVCEHGVQTRGAGSQSCAHMCKDTLQLAWPTSRPRTCCLWTRWTARGQLASKRTRALLLHMWKHTLEVPWVPGP